MTAAGHHPPIVGSPPASPAPGAGAAAPAALPGPRHLRWASEHDTAAFAARLAAHADIGNAFLELRGDLGAGKTTFVRHLLRALGVQGRIKSPTYAVVEPHEGRLPGSGPAPGQAPAPLSIWHFDFYRFSDPREWEDAGFRDLFAQPGLKLAEWPDKAAGLLPVPDLVLALETGEDEARRVTLSAGTPRGARLLEA